MQIFVKCESVGRIFSINWNLQVRHANSLFKSKSEKRIFTSITKQYKFFDDIKEQLLEKCGTIYIKFKRLNVLSA